MGNFLVVASVTMDPAELLRSSGPDELGKQGHDYRLQYQRFGSANRIVLALAYNKEAAGFTPREVDFAQKESSRLGGSVSLDRVGGEPVTRCRS